jgi:hypothetical protein
VERGELARDSERLLSGEDVNQLSFGFGRVCGADSPECLAMHPAWQIYRRRERLFLYGLVTYPFCMSIIGISIDHLHLNDAIIYGIAAVWGCFLIFTYLRVALMRCPRCGKLFFFKYGFNAYWLTSKCKHCALPEYADP